MLDVTANRPTLDGLFLEFQAILAPAGRPARNLKRSGGHPADGIERRRRPTAIGATAPWLAGAAVKNRPNYPIRPGRKVPLTVAKAFHSLLMTDAAP